MTWADFAVLIGLIILMSLLWVAAVHAFCNALTYNILADAKYVKDESIEEILL